MKIVVEVITARDDQINVFVHEIVPGIIHEILPGIVPRIIYGAVHPFPSAPRPTQRTEHYLYMLTLASIRFCCFYIGFHLRRITVGAMKAIQDDQTVILIDLIINTRPTVLVLGHGRLIDLPLIHISWVSLLIFILFLIVALFL